MSRRHLAIPAALLLTVAACSSGDDDPAADCTPIPAEDIAELAEGATSDVELGDGYFYPLPAELQETAPVDLHDFAAVAASTADGDTIAVFAVGDETMGPTIALGEARDDFEWGSDARPDGVMGEWIEAAETDPTYNDATACLTR